VDDDDDVLLAMAECLDEPFVKLVGGKSHAFAMLPPLELLSTVEELSVRDRAVASLARVIGCMSEADTEAHGVPLVTRLGERDWFTSRIAAAGLAASVYRAASAASKASVVDLFKRLCKDDTPMVRRAAAMHLSEFARALPVADIATDALALATQLSSDEQDGVRLLAAEAFAQLAPLVPAASRTGSVVPPLTRLAKDTSWRVRWAAASQCLAVCAALRGVRASDPAFASQSASSSSASSSSAAAAPAGRGKDEDDDVDTEAPLPEPAPDADTACADLGNAFADLLGDSEPEVRSAAAARVSQVALQARNSGVTDRVMEHCTSLAEDDNEHVRAALAGSVLGLVGVLPEARAEHELIPVVLKLLEDKASQVRLSVIERLEEVNEVVESAMLSKTLLPAIVDLSEDGQWRVRHALLGFMPLLARQLGEETFMARLTAICLAWLEDDVANVRDDGAANLRAVTDVFGDSWAVKALLPPLLKKADDPSYLIRVTVLRAAAHLSGEMPATTAAAGASSSASAASSASASSHTQLVDEHLVPLVAKMFKDPVPNVRFNAAKAAAVIAGAASARVRDGTLAAGLDMLRTGDSDKDVKHFAAKALEALTAKA
jgi:serine/threonine-protein phosphatase 2A regulatory subunit A